MPDPVSYTAVLPIGESTATFVAGLLDTERRRRRTRQGRRALDSLAQAVLVLRWFLDGTRVAQLAGDNQLSSSTAYRYLHEAIDVLAAVAPGVHGALLAARMAGHTHVHLDGTLIRTDRSKAVGPTVGVDPWWSGKHHHHVRTSRCSLRQMDGRCGPRRCVRVASTTRPAPVAMTGCSMPSPIGLTKAMRYSPTWVTRVRTPG